MSHFKTTFFQAVNKPADDLGEESAERQTIINTAMDRKNGQGEIICPDDYSPIWRTAFALAHNVQFTRTPDVELMRKRAAVDPAYAELLRKIKEKTRVKYEVPAPERQAQDTINEEREDMPVSTAKILRPYHEEKIVVDEKAPEAAARLKNPISVFISDSAFFECMPFELHDFVENAGEQNEIVSADKLMENSTSTAQSQEELTHLYRVVECRQPRMKWVSDPAEDAQDVEKTQDMTVCTTEKETAEDVELIDTTAMAEASSGPKVDSNPQAAAIEQATETFPLVEDIDNGLAGNDVFVPTRPPVKPDVMISPPHEIEHKHTSPERASLSVMGRDYVFPPITLLQKPLYKEGNIISQETLERSAGLLENVLEDFGIKGEIIHVRPGPVVTLYEFEPAPGVKSSRVIGLSDDIARSMSAVSARVAVIPGRNVIGIELPNSVREMVYLREIIQSRVFETTDYKLPLALGKNIGGEPAIAELAKMPHLLVAGTTGSGKSVAINTMVLSLLYRMPPEKCRLIMVDPKMLELSIYDGIPHLLTPVVTDPKKAVTALKWAVREMENRYRKMARLGVRNIDGFNARISEALKNGEIIMCTVQAGFDKETGEMLYSEEAMDLTPLPYIVIIVDEMADLMMVAGKEIEGAIQRLAQMARAAGIHLIMATQRPSVDVITGTIKANFPTRVSFQVTSKIDSRTILGEQGAETLLGQGDMLHMIGGGRLVRVHGPFVSDREVEHVVAHLKTQGTPEYLATVTSNDGDEAVEDGNSADAVAELVANSGGGGDDSEELYVRAVKVVMRDKKCSTSYIQRRLGIGYNKAALLVERMEEEGLVGSANHVGKREILLSSGNRPDGVDK